MSTTFNALKSASMLVTRNKKKPTLSSLLQIGGASIPAVETTRHLGVLLSSNLQWSAHIGHLVQAVSWKVALLKRLAFRTRLPISVFSLLYRSLIRPCLEYASSVWDGCSSTDSFMLERIQLALARSILSSHFGFDYVSSLSKSHLLLLLHWPTLSWRRRRHKLILFWKLKNGLGPPSLSQRLPTSASVRCSYSLRSSHSSQIPLCSSSAHLSSFLPSSCVLWNALPSSVVDVKSLSSFISHLDTHFKSDMYSYGIPN